MARSAENEAVMFKGRMDEAEAGRRRSGVQRPQRGGRLGVVTAVIVTLLFSSSRSPANPFPPYWGGGSGAAVHFAPVAWPGDAAWRAYTKEGNTINDQRTQDPSNGGTSPQNYVNVSSNCTDQALPSVFWQYDAAGQVLFFRWRVEQIPHTYATGPSPGTFSSTDPWKSAQWTVFIDTDGDGFREFAVHLNGSSGSPSTSVDQLAGIYSDTPNQSVDYIGDPSIFLLAHNPTAFVDQATNRILNFQSSLTPVTTWPNGSSETVWDYGTTRARNISTASPACTEYLVEYQIPLGLLDASGVSGPTITASTPISLAFATANSLTNPLQKDFVLDGDFITDPTREIPFGDTIIPDGGTVQQPIVRSIAASGCGPTALTAQVSDSLDCSTATGCQTTVTAVDFYYYFDRNGNGLPDDGESWTLAAAGATGGTIGRWTASWNSAAVERGQYLIGVQAVDNATLNATGKANRTFSYLSAAEVAALSPPAGEDWFANPSPIPGVVRTIANNTCGVPPPSVTKSASPSYVPAGSSVDFTITNPTASPISVTGIEDDLPAGFSYASDQGGTLVPPAPSGSPAADATGTISWSFSGNSVPAASSRTFIFRANTDPAAVVGTYTNVARAITSAGTLTSDPVDVAVGAPRLTIAKAASVATANPGATITYTISYSNDSPVSVPDAVITDTLPAGLTFVSATGGGTYDGPTRTVTWTVGAIASGDGPSR